MSVCLKRQLESFFPSGGSSPNTLKASINTFRVASYEHEPVSIESTGDNAKFIIQQNLQDFKEQAEIAALQVTRTILFSKTVVLHVFL